MGSATKDVIQEVRFACTPEKLYRHLTEPDLVKKFSKTTDGFLCDSRVGGKMRLFNGTEGSILIEIEIVEMVANRKLVINWRVGSWDAGVSSEATFALSGPPEGPTDLKLTHLNVPEFAYDGVVSGWPKYYWNPLRELVE